MNTPTTSLALRPKEAAKALNVSARTLWSWTREGKVPHVRIGKAILYPVKNLQDWLSEQAKQSQPSEEQQA